MAPYKYNETKLPGSSASGDRVKIVEDFLSEHYDIKINVFDPSRSFIVPKDKSLTHEPTLDHISLHMESHGIRGCDSILKKIIRSGYRITTFNPITEYLSNLEGKWQGESHIDILCDNLLARDFGDKTEGYYQDRMKHIIKKWLAASVACSLGIKANDAMLGFIHADEGIGKTFLAEFLVPQSLRQYYIKSSKDDRMFRISAAFTKNFIVNFDECVGITNTTADEFKSTLSSLTLTMSNTFTQQIKRIANGFFTSNRTKELGGFLTDKMGHRRFATIELEEINQAYSKEVDVDQLWAEAFVLFKNADFNYEWDKEDFLEFKEYNSRYLIETTAHKLIKEFYRIPELDEVAANKQPIEILRDLRNCKKIPASMNISEIDIGRALSRLGYPRKSKRVGLAPRYGYEVIPLFE